jgi:hypothetical protein
LASGSYRAADPEVLPELDEPGAPSSVDDLDRPTPPSGIRSFEYRRESVPQEGELLDEIDLGNLGRLADKMFALGRRDAAVKIIASPIEQVVASARSQKVDDAVVDTAGFYAVKLARETLEGRWLDAAIELHLLAARALREETLQQVALLRSKHGMGDERLIELYYARLRAEMPYSTPGERLLCERIAGLLLGGS